MSFDSNGYRNFVKGKTLSDITTEVQQLRAQEAAKGYVPFICPTVAMELISHLLDSPQSTSFGSCLKACQAMYLHCGNTTQFRILPLPEVQIAKEYFGIADTHAIQNETEIGQILFQLSQSPTQTTIQANFQNIQRIKQFIRNAEQTYSDQVLQFMQGIDPQAQRWNFFQNNQSKRNQFLKEIRSANFKLITAKAMLMAIALTLQAKGYLLPSPTPQEFQNQIQNYIDSYATSLLYRQRCWEQFITPNYNISQKSRANAIWDEYILHFIGHRINGEDILLVTDDKKMIEAARSIDPNALIYTYKDYIQSL